MTALQTRCGIPNLHDAMPQSTLHHVLLTLVALLRFYCTGGQRQRTAGSPGPRPNQRLNLQWACMGGPAVLLNHGIMSPGLPKYT